MANSLEKPLGQQPVQTSEIVPNELYEHKKGARSGPASKEAACIPCSIEKTLDVIGGKWAFLVLRELFGGTKRFGELQRNIHNISPTALTNTLRHMEEKGVLERRVYPTVPVTVEYTLTPKGEDLHPIIKGMKLWAAKWA